jgi:U3 small nucleolar RNA-associated protein 19
MSPALTSASQMLEAELSREVKKTPVVEYEIPKKIFTKENAELDVEASLLVRLWKF